MATILFIIFFTDGMHIKLSIDMAIHEATTVFHIHSLCFFSIYISFLQPVHFL